jgi:PTS system trehalose-specific IIC component
MEESGHACAISCFNGLQVMLHIGLDTVKMNGAGFEYLIQKDQTVSAGTPLIRFDRTKIKAAGYQDVIICVITENSNDLPLEFHTGMTAKAKETTIITF